MVINMLLVTISEFVQSISDTVTRHHQRIKERSRRIFLFGRSSGEKWCGRRYSRSLPTTIFSCSVEPEIESKRKFRYGNQGAGTIDNTDTGIYFLENKYLSILNHLLSCWNNPE
jgi:hypothetical protein